MGQISLTNILRNGNRESLKKQWADTKAAADFAPLPAGEYVADVIDGKLDETRNGKPEYRLTFRVAEGEYVRRLFWLHVYLTPAALPMAKRDLGKIGVTDLDQLDQPLPAVFRCKVKLALRKDDNGNTDNRIRSFQVLEIVKPERDAFAPGDDASDGTAEPGDKDKAKELFPFGENAAGSGPYGESR